MCLYRIGRKHSFLLRTLWDKRLLQLLEHDSPGAMIFLFQLPSPSTLPAQSHAAEGKRSAESHGFFALPLGVIAKPLDGSRRLVNP